MYLILQGTRVQVQVLEPCKSVQESSEEVLSIKARQIARQIYLLRFNIWSLKDNSIVVSIENYEIQISRSNFMHSHVYLCRVSFLTTLDIYKDYFEGHQRWCNLMQSDYSLKLWLETICPSSSFSQISCCVCAPRVL